MRTILALIGSANSHSANLTLVRYLEHLLPSNYKLEIDNHLDRLPHFDPNLSLHHPPEVVKEFRERIAKADAVLISTPEYVFSIPSRLKNAIEWCVSTTVFSKKPTALITASASGIKSHEELKFIMQTLEARFNPQNTLLITGVKGKTNEETVTDEKLKVILKNFIENFIELIES